MNFERGQDPKEAIGIGVYGMHKFKDDYEAADFIMTVLPTVLEVEDIKDLSYNSLYPGTKTWDKLANYTVDCIRVESGNFREPTYGHPDGSLMGILRMRIEDKLILNKLFLEAEAKGYAIRKGK